MLFLARRLDGLLAEARAALGAYVGADPDDLVFVPNASSGVNVAAWPLGLQAGRRGAVDRPRVRGARPRLGARVRRLRRAVREDTDPASGRRARTRSSRRSGPASGRARRCSSSAIHTSSTALDAAGRGALPPRARARDPLDRRRRARAGPPPARTCARSMRTSTQATVTSGCARRKAPAFSTSAVSSSATCIPSCQLGVRRRRPELRDRHEKQGTRDPSAYLDRSGGDRVAARPRLGCAARTLPRPRAPCAKRARAGAAHARLGGVLPPDGHAAPARRRAARPEGAAVRRVPNRGARCSSADRKASSVRPSRATTTRPISSGCATPWRRCSKRRRVRERMLEDVERLFGAERVRSKLSAGAAVLDRHRQTRS